MPKATPLQSSFSSGEVTPLFYGQVENPRYKKGLKTGLNFLPMLQGPIVRRPATKFCAAAKNAAAPYLVPFKFSETQSYMLEFGDQYIRFFANNGQMVTTGTTLIVTGDTAPYMNQADATRVNLGRFFASRASAILQPFESAIITQTSVPAATILEIASPYLIADLPQVRWAQNADTLYLCHPNYPVYKLQRQAQTYWKLSPVIFQDGPYLALNTYKTYGDCANFNMHIVSSVAAPPGTAVIQMDGTNISGMIADPALTGQIQVTTATAHGMLSGQKVFITGVTGTVEANNWDAFGAPAQPQVSWPIIVTSPTTFLLAGSVFVNAYVAGGITAPALFSDSALARKNGTAIPDTNRLLGFIVGGKRYYGYLSMVYTTGVNNAAMWEIIWPGSATIAATITAWQLGVYSPGFGFPSCLSFHQNRLVFGGPIQQVNGSMVGQYETFSPSDPLTLNVSDKNAYSFELNSSEVNVMQWMASTSQGLLAGTLVSEWVITPASTSDALTPTNFNAQQSSYFGAAPTAPVQIGNGTLYIQGARRKVREMSFFFNAGTFRSIDMTELSEHITLPKVLQLAVTKETQPLIWGVRSDGTLVSMVYNRDDLTLVAGWTRHILGGSSDSAGTQPLVKSIGSIPAPTLDFDQLWLVVQRYINGSTVYNIEYMTKIFDDSVAQADAFQLDCGGTLYSGFTIASVSIAATARMVVNGLLADFPGFVNGDRVTIDSGGIGLNKSSTDANGNVTISNLINGKQFIVTNAVTTTGFGLRVTAFDLYTFEGVPVSSVGYGAYLSGGLAAKMITNVSGATWLRNETISVLVDGGIHPPVTVDNSGAFTLNFPGAKVQIGYAYKSRGQLLRIDAGSPDGTSIGKTRRSTRVAIQMHRTGDLALGTSFDNLIPVKLGEQLDVDLADEAMPLFSGMIREGLESAYDFESEPCFEMSSALPGCIQSVSTFMEEFDV